MKSDKLKKAVNFAMRDFYNPQNIAAKFLLGIDDNELIQRINNDDISALWQFTFKHSSLLHQKILMKGLLSDLQYRVADKSLPYFMDNIKAFAAKYKDRKLSDYWEIELQRTFRDKLWDMIQEAKAEHSKAWMEFEFTDWHVEFLNNLNDFLTLTEEKIVKRAILEVPEWEIKVKDAGNTTSDYEYFVDISYFIKNSDGNPVYVCYHPFHIKLYDEADGSWGLLCDGEDWIESGWLPKLNNRCCYLMHELVYHSHLGQLIFEIDDIWVDTKIWDQSIFSFSDMKWKNRMFSDD